MSVLAVTTELSHLAEAGVSNARSDENGAISKTARFGAERTRGLLFPAKPGCLQLSPGRAADQPDGAGLSQARAVLGRLLHAGGGWGAGSERLDQIT